MFKRFEVLSCAKWERTIIDIQTLQDLVHSEFLQCEHGQGVTANIPIDQVVITGLHNAEDGNSLLPPEDLESFCECCHEE